MPSDQEAETIATYDRTARQWARAHGGVNDWQWVAEKFGRFLPAGKVLEVGCGGGRDAKELLRLGYDYTGTDASPSMVKVAKETVPAGRFMQCSVYDVAKLGRVFDGFWACAVLLHIPKARINEALQAIRACVRPGAIGMISMKDGDNEEFEVRDKDGLHEERLFAYWRKGDFTQALAENGFAVVEYQYRPVSQRTNWHVFFVKKEGLKQFFN